MYKCVICGKGTGTGNRVSKSNRRTKRTWLPNLHRFRILHEGKVKRAYVCTRCLRSGKVVKV